MSRADFTLIPGGADELDAEEYRDWETPWKGCHHYRHLKTQRTLCLGCMKLKLMCVDCKPIFVGCGSKCRARHRRFAREIWNTGPTTDPIAHDVAVFIRYYTVKMEMQRSKGIHYGTDGHPLLFPDKYADVR